MTSCLLHNPPQPKPHLSPFPHPNPHRRQLSRHSTLRLLLQNQTLTLTSQHLLQIHAHILRFNLANSDPYLLSHLFRLYSSLTPLSLSSRLFSLFPNPPTFSFNLFIRQHTIAGDPAAALLLFHRLLSSNLPPDKFTFPFALRSCAALSDSSTGRALHAAALKSGFSRDPFLFNALITLYFACKDPDNARKVFDKMRVRNVVTWTALVSGLVACGDLAAARAAFDVMPERNVVSWTAMIDGCVRNGSADEAFVLFGMMMREKRRPNSYTIVGLLMACAELGSLRLGRRVHEFAERNGMVEGDCYVGTALIDMYSKCGSIGDAVDVFQKAGRSVATWNSMITGLGVHGRGKDALELFDEMREENVVPDGITFVGVLCACARSGMVGEGMRLFMLMKEHYKIEPGVKHYECLAELFGSVSIPHEETDEITMGWRACGDAKVVHIVEDYFRQLKLTEDSTIE